MLRSSYITIAFSAVAICSGQVRASPELASIISVARLGTQLISGDPQGAILAGNRQILLGLSQKLNVLEDRQRLMLRLLVSLPEDFRKILAENNIKVKNEKLIELLVRFKRLEDNFERYSKHNFPNAWKLHYDQLIILKAQFYQVLDSLSIDTGPLSMPSRAAAYAYLLVIQGQIIAIDKMIHKLGQQITLKMGFQFSVIERKRRIAERIDERLQLTKKALRETRNFLEGPLLEQIRTETQRLQAWQKMNGILHDWFPKWLGRNVKSFQKKIAPDFHMLWHSWQFPATEKEIKSGIADIASLLKKYCPNGTHVQSSEDWLHTVIFDLHEYHCDGKVCPPKSDAFKKALATQKECGIFDGVLTRFRYLPFIRRTILNKEVKPDSTVKVGTVKFRTPSYRIITIKEPKNATRSNQYIDKFWKFEVEIDVYFIPRVAETHWTLGNNKLVPKPLPGLDTEFFRRYTIGSSNKKSILQHFKNVMQDDILKRMLPTHFVHRAGGFMLQYYQVKNLYEDDPYWTDVKTVRCLNWAPPFYAVPVYPHKNARLLSEQINQLYYRMYDSLDRVPIETLITKRCERPIIGWGPIEVKGRRWRPVHTPSWHKHFKVRKVNRPSSWAKGNNEQMRVLHYLLSVQAEIERSYVAFQKFLERLQKDEEPELEYAITPWNAAALISRSMDSERIERVLEVLTLEERSAELDTQFDILVSTSARDIAKELEISRIASYLQLGLAMAEIGLEYIAMRTTADYRDVKENERLSSSDDVGVVPEEVGSLVEREIDIENIENERELRTLLMQLKETSSESADSKTKVASKFEHAGGSSKQEFIGGPPKVFEFVGGVKSGKTGILVIKKGGVRLGRLYIKRKALKRGANLEFLMDSYAWRIFGPRTGTKIRVSIDLAKNKLSKSEASQFLLLQEALAGRGSHFLSFKGGKRLKQFKLDRRQAIKLGVRHICQGVNRCSYLLSKPNTYEGIRLTRGRYEFRMGSKKGKLEINFGVKGHGAAKPENVHATIDSLQ